VTMCFVDKGYEAQRGAFETNRISITVVQRNDKQIKGFVVLPKRWVVERTFGWINRARRPAKEFEAIIESALAWLLIPSRSSSHDASPGSPVKKQDFRVGLLDDSGGVDRFWLAVSCCFVSRKLGNL
jgi:hypothetical protein